VSRAAYDSLMDERGRVWAERCAYSKLCEKFAVTADKRDTEIQRLTDVIVQMRREGFNPLPSGGNMEVLDLDLDQGIMDAIAQRSTDGSELSARLTKWALAAMREKGADPEEVSQMILKGGSPQEEE